MSRFHSTGARRAADLAAIPFSALSMGDLQELHQMLRDRDLMHVDDDLARQEIADSVLEAGGAAARRAARHGVAA